MNRLLLGIATLLAGAMLVAANADAARLGGGRSLGMQRNHTAPPAGAPARQAAPAAQPKAPNAVPASGLSRWMPMLGGLALGGLLGSMFGGGGFGGGLGGVLLMALIALGVFMLVRMLLRRREPAAPRPMQFANLGGEAPTAFEPVGAAAAYTSAPSAANPPPGFDAEGFLRTAKMNFIKLQAANDSGDVESLREVVTPEMFDELSKDIRERSVQTQTTDIVMVDATLLGMATEGARHLASVRFAGMVREEPRTPPKSFHEVWNLTKPVDGTTGWLLAGIQQEAA